MTGALMLAMLAVGTSPYELPKVIPEKRFDVNGRSAAVYDALYDNYMRIHGSLGGS